MLGGEDTIPVTDARRWALIVAPEADRADALRQELAVAGMEPVVVENAAAAERRAADALPDVLILDRGMPGLALFRLYSSVRGKPGGADMPMYFVGEPGTDTPTDHYLPEGIVPSAIVDRLREDGRLGEGYSTPRSVVADAHAPTSLDHDVTTAEQPVVMHDESVTEIAPIAAEVIAAEAIPAEAVPVEPFPAEAIPPDPSIHVTTAAPDPIASPPGVPIEEQPRQPIVEQPREPIVASVRTVEPERSAVEISPVPAEEPPTSRISRLDVILLRLGLVLLLLGGAVLLLRPDSSTQPIAPPNLATATPSTTRVPAASPSPAAVVPAGSAAVAPADAAGRR